MQHANYEKPRLKKITKVNYFNPSLNSQNVTGVFQFDSALPLIRNELRYGSPIYKDSLERTVAEETKKMKQSPGRVNTEQGQGQPITAQQTWRNRSNRSYHFEGTNAIKTKQMHGYNIVNNF